MNFFESLVKDIFENNEIIKNVEPCHHCSNLKNKIKNISTYDKKRKEAVLGILNGFEFPKKTKLNEGHFQHLLLTDVHFDMYGSYLNCYICEKCLTAFELFQSSDNNSYVNFKEFNKIKKNNYYYFLPLLLNLYKKHFFNNYVEKIRSYTEPIEVYGIYTKKLYRGHHKELLKSNKLSFTKESLEWIHVYEDLPFISHSGFMHSFFQNTYLLKIKVKPYHLFLDELSKEEFKSAHFVMNRNDAISVEMYNPEKDTWIKNYQKISHESYDKIIREKFNQWNETAFDKFKYKELIQPSEKLVDTLIFNQLIHDIKYLYPESFNKLYQEVLEENTRFNEMIENDDTIKELLSHLKNKSTSKIDDAND